MSDVELTINAQLQGILKATQQMKEFVQVTSNGVNRIEGNFKDLNKQTGFFTGVLGKVTLAATAFNQVTAAIRTVTQYFGAAIDAAAAQEAATNELNEALRINGLYTDRVSKNLQEYASELQRTSRYSDDAIIRAQAFITTLTNLNEAGLKKATKATVDLAAALNIDLQTAAKYVADATKDGTISLRGITIQLGKGKTEAETAAIALEALNQKFGGRSVAQLNTYAGQVDRVRNAWGDLLEEVGMAVIKNDLVIRGLDLLTRTINDLTPPVKWLADRFLELSGAAVKVFEYIYDLNAALAELVRVLFLPISGVNKLKDSLDEHNKSLEVTKNTLSTISKFVIDAFVEKYTTLLKFLQLGTIQLKKAFGGDVTKDIVTFNEKLAETETGLLNTGKAALKIPESLKKLAEQFRNAGKTRVEVLKVDRDRLIREVDELIKSDVRLTSEGERVKRLIKLDFASKIAEEQSKIQKEQRERELKEIERQKSRLTDLMSGDVMKIATEITLNPKLSGIDFAALGGSFVKSISEGAEGARKAVVGAMTAIISKINPIVGQIAGPLLDFFSKGKDFVRQQSEAFVKAIPEVNKALVEGALEFVRVLIRMIPQTIKDSFYLIPTLLQSLMTGINDIVLGIIDTFAELPFILIDSLPDVIDRTVELIEERFPDMVSALIDRISERAPEIVMSFSRAMIQASPMIAVRIATSFIGFLPLIAVRFAVELVTQAPYIAVEIVRAFIREIPNMAREMASQVGGAISDAINRLTGGVSNIGQTVGGFFSGVVNTARGFLGIAEGGIVKDRRAPSDTVPAWLTPGELVVDRRTTGKLQDFLEGTQGGDMIALLGSINSKIGNQPIIIQIGSKEIVNVIRESLASGRVLA